jgi:hypothetical protein
LTILFGLKVGISPDSDRIRFRNRSIIGGIGQNNTHMNLGKYILMHIQKQSLSKITTISGLRVVLDKAARVAQWLERRAQRSDDP